MTDTYVVTKTTTDTTTNTDTVAFLFMLANNGVYFTTDIEKAIIFHDSTIATKQAEVVAVMAMLDDATYAAKQVTLEDLISE